MKAVKKGYVYIALNLVNELDKVKIGFTSKAPKQRAKDLTTEGMTGRFTAIYWIETPYYKQFEKRVHAKLRRYRYAKTEFFTLSSKEAIDAVKYLWTEFEKELDINEEVTIEDIKQKTQIIKWWESLDYHWRRTFRKNLYLDFKPTKEELINGLNKLILYEGETTLRKKVGSWISKKNFEQKLTEHFNVSLKMKEQREYLAYIDRMLSINQLKDILRLEKFNCFNNSQIHSIWPLKSLRKLKDLDASNTKIENLDALGDLKYLEKIKINHTQVSSLAPLYQHKRRLIVGCYNCPISNDEKERMERMNEKCKIENVSFMIKN